MTNSVIEGLEPNSDLHAEDEDDVHTSPERVEVRVVHPFQHITIHPKPSRPAYHCLRNLIFRRKRHMEWRLSCGEGAPVDSVPGRWVNPGCCLGGVGYEGSGHRDGAGAWGF